MLAAELVNPADRAADAKLAGALMQRAKENGLLVGKGGLYGNVLRMAPPMTITEEEAAEGLDILRRTFDEVC
jgi:4-aminobutyrate aminotransferase